MTAKEALAARIATLETEQLLEIARTLNLKTSAEEVLVACAVDRELESRLSEAEFLALMDEFNAELDAA